MMKMRINKSIARLCQVSAVLLFMPLAASAFDYPEKGDFNAGSKTWSENCTRCHNMRSPTDLRDDQWLTTMFHMRARAGLTGQETRDVLTFLQGSNARTTVSTGAVVVDASGASASGEELYNANCAACHGGDGKGAMPGLPDFTASGGRMSKSDGELLSNIINGFQTPGGVMPMPPRGGNSTLTDADLAAVLEYLRSSFAPN